MIHSIDDGKDDHHLKGSKYVIDEHDQYQDTNLPIGLTTTKSPPKLKLDDPSQSKLTIYYRFENFNDSSSGEHQKVNYHLDDASVQGSNNHNHVKIDGFNINQPSGRSVDGRNNGNQYVGVYSGHNSGSRNSGGQSSGSHNSGVQNNGQIDLTTQSPSLQLLPPLNHRKIINTILDAPKTTVAPAIDTGSNDDKSYVEYEDEYVTSRFIDVRTTESPANNNDYYRYEDSGPDGGADDGPDDDEFHEEIKPAINFNIKPIEAPNNKDKGNTNNWATNSFNHKINFDSIQSSTATTYHSTIENYKKNLINNLKPSTRYKIHDQNGHLQTTTSFFEYPLNDPTEPSMASSQVTSDKVSMKNQIINLYRPVSSAFGSSGVTRSSPRTSNARTSGLRTARVNGVTSDRTSRVTGAVTRQNGPSTRTKINLPSRLVPNESESAKPKVQSSNSTKNNISTSITNKKTPYEIGYNIYNVNDQVQNHVFKRPAYVKIVRKSRLKGMPKMSLLTRASLLGSNSNINLIDKQLLMDIRDLNFNGDMIIDNPDDIFTGNLNDKFENEIATTNGLTNDQRTSGQGTTGQNPRGQNTRGSNGQRGRSRLAVPPRFQDQYLKQQQHFRDAKNRFKVSSPQELPLEMPINMNQLNRDAIVIDYRNQRDRINYIDFLGVANSPKINHESVKLIEIPIRNNGTGKSHLKDDHGSPGQPKITKFTAQDAIIPMRFTPKPVAQRINLNHQSASTLPHSGNNKDAN